MGTLSSILAPSGVATLSTTETLSNKTLASPNLTGTTRIGYDLANFVQGVGAASGSIPVLSAQGSDANVGLAIKSKGTGPVVIGTNGTDKVTVDTSGNLTFQTTGAAVNNVASINGGQLAGLRNKIINGKMEVAQRGTSFAAIASGAYSLDRFIAGYGTVAVVTASQQADAPSGDEFQNSLRFTVTTADATITAADLFVVGQPIEGYNVRDLIGRTFTLSFWVRSAKTGVHCASFRNAGLDRSYVAEYTVNAANTWEKKTITVSGGLITAGTWNWTNGAGLYVNWILAAGSNFQTSAGAWQTGSLIATANQVNCLDTVGNIFAITGVQLEVGSVATPFEHRPYGVELALCQRYLPAFNGLGPVSSAWAYGSTGGYAVFPIQVQPRVAPTGMTVSSASHFSVFNSGAGGLGLTALTFHSATSTAAFFNFTTTSGLVAGGGTSIFSSSASAQILFTGCEL